MKTPAPLALLVALAAPATDGAPPAIGGTLPTADPWTLPRERMVREQIERRGIADPRVLAAMRSVPRHRFVPARLVDEAYADHPLSIGHDQTISQPYIVALMSELAAIRPGHKVLEIGTGSGYQAAVLAELGARVFSIEISQPLCLSASARLQQLGYGQVTVRCGDGYGGWPEQAPFDAIVVTAAPRTIPQPLLDQLRDGGRLVIPVGAYDQQLVRLTRVGAGYERENVIPVRFVPMTGEVERAPRTPTSAPN